MSNDPCRPQRVLREIHMHQSIQQLLERSEKVQSDEVGQALDLSEEDAGQEAGAAAQKTVGEWGSAFSAGWRRKSLTSTAESDAVGAAGAVRSGWEVRAGGEAAGVRTRSGRGLAEEQAGEAVSGVHSVLDPAVLEALNWRNLTLFAQTVAAWDMLGEGASLRTRPMVLHKVANPLHMHYLHWRLLHCSVPKKDLIGGAGEVLAQRDLPSLHEIFHITPRQKPPKSSGS